MKALSGSDVVPIGGLRVVVGEDRVLCTVVASCVAVILHDPVARVGGMLHAVLPCRAEGRTAAPHPASYYVDTGIAALLDAVLKAGASRERLQALLVGGACSVEGGADRGQVGNRNVAGARATLIARELPLTEEVTGGGQARSVRFHLDAGYLSLSQNTLSCAGEASADRSSRADGEGGRLIAELDRWGPEPEVAARLLEILHRSEFEWDEVRQIARADLLLSFQIMSLFNSSYYGCPGKVATWQSAVRELGRDRVRRIGVVAAVKRQSSVRPEGLQEVMIRMNRHARASGLVARLLTKCMPLGDELREAVYNTASLHVLGHLAREWWGLTSRPGRIARLMLAERQFPQQIIQAVDDQAEEPPGKVQGSEVALAEVVAASCACSQLLGIDTLQQCGQLRVSRSLLQRCGFADGLDELLPQVLQVLRHHGVVGEADLAGLD